MARGIKNAKLAQPVGFLAEASRGAPAKPELPPDKELVPVLATKGSVYLQVLQLLAQGLSVAKVAKELCIAPGYVYGIRKSAQKRAERMVANDWQDAMIQQAKETVMLGMQDPTAYPCAKVSVSALKGLKVFATGEGVPPAPANGGNTTIYQNVQILMNMKPEEKEQLLDEARRGVLDSPVEGHGAVRRLGTGDEEARERSAVVAEKPDEDV